jgi:hypothetical protein
MLIFGYVLLLIILGYSICRLDFKDPEQLTIAEPQLSPEEALRRCYRSALGAHLSFSNDEEN